MSIPVARGPASPPVSTERLRALAAKPRKDRSIQILLATVAAAIVATCSGVLIRIAVRSNTAASETDAMLVWVLSCLAVGAMDACAVAVALDLLNPSTFSLWHEVVTAPPLVAKLPGEESLKAHARNCVALGGEYRLVPICTLLLGIFVPPTVMLSAATGSSVSIGLSSVRQLMVCMVGFQLGLLVGFILLVVRGWLRPWKPTAAAYLLKARGEAAGADP